MFNRRRVYLDTAAAAPVTPSSREAFMRAVSTFGNPSGMHEEGRSAKKVLEKARVSIARLAGAKTEHVVFTSGATEANALAIGGTIETLLKTGRSAQEIEVLYHPGAHASLVHQAEALLKRGVLVRELPLVDGDVSIKELENMLSERTALVTLEVISSETGRRMDTRAIRRALDAYTKEGPHIVLHVDASQLPLVEPIDRTRLGADLMTLDAQKAGGVRGIGVLIRAKDVRLSPVVFGGGQEQGLRPGTESPALAESMANALTVAEKNREPFSKGAEAVRTRLIRRVQEGIPDALVLGGPHHAPHILTFALPGRDADYLVALLDEAGFAISTKSACETDSGQGSRMALAETRDALLSTSTLRISWNEAISERDLERFSEALIKSVRFLDRKRT